MDDLDLSKLNNEYRSIGENEEVCARIGKHCHKNAGIRYLHVSLWSLEREGIVGFFQHWKGEQSQLLGLDLCAPNFGDAGRLGGVGVGEIMERFLNGNKTLRELHLNWLGMNLNNAVKRRREYRYAVEQGSEYTGLMIRQHVGGGKGLYLPSVGKFGARQKQVWGRGSRVAVKCHKQNVNNQKSEPL